jgi:hypothetical protein
MANKHKPLILTPTLSAPQSAEPIFPKNRPALPKIKSVQPFGSKILVETLRDDEIMGTNLYVGAGKGSGQGDGAPQALIIKLGPKVEADAGLKEGQRIYWTGKGTLVEDPATTEGRSRALLEISNILAVIEEKTEDADAE